MKFLSSTSLEVGDLKQGGNDLIFLIILLIDSVGSKV
jgi:hypothetical protein